jgi:hypothetical protein
MLTEGALFMRLKTTVVSLTAAAAMLTTPAFAAHQPPAAHGKATAPGQLCKSQSHKKTNRGKGKSPFAACVLGAKRARAELTRETSTRTAPGQLCKDQSRRKSATDSKSPFAACVTGAAKAQREQRS